MPFSIPTMWKYTNAPPADENDISAFGILRTADVRVIGVAQMAEYCSMVPSSCNGTGETPGLIEKLRTIKDELGTKSILFSLLRNVPDKSFFDIFYDLGPAGSDTIRNCSNRGIKCKNFTLIDSGLFPECYEYFTSEKKDRFSMHRVSDEGISSGVNFILMTGTQLASQALREHNKRAANNGGDVMRLNSFDNTFSPYSSDGIRLMITSPGETPDMNERGINISPGSSILISITGREIKRLSWPYSSCTDVNEEFEVLQQNVRESKHFQPSASDLKYSYSYYTPDECRAACYQNFIWIECSCLDVNSILPYPSSSLSKILCGTLAEESMDKFLNATKHNTENCFGDASKLNTKECSFLHQWIEDLACLKEAKQKYAEKKLTGQHDCYCPSACKSYHYDLTVTQTRWPAAGAEMNAAYHNLVGGKKELWNFGLGDGTTGEGNVNVTDNGITQSNTDKALR